MTTTKRQSQKIKPKNKNKICENNKKQKTHF